MEPHTTPPNRILRDRFERYWIISPDERAQLQRLRLKGGKRPPQISLGDWSGQLKMHYLLHLGCHLFAAGAPNRKIARMIEQTESRTSIFMSSSLARLYVAGLLRQQGREKWQEWAYAYGYWSGPDR
jgi:hypothetical protein